MPDVPDVAQGGSASLLDDLPPEIQLQILENHSMSLEEAKKLASQRLSSSDGAELWAYQHFDPSMDNYAIVKKWEQMSESPAKNELKEKMMMNPKLKNILEWERGLALTYNNLLAPTYTNFVSAIIKGNSDVVKYLIAKGIRPNREHLLDAIDFSDNLQMVEALIKAGAIPDAEHLDSAILKNNLPIVKALIKGGAKLNQKLLSYAKLNGNQDIINALTEAMAAPLMLLRNYFSSLTSDK